MPSDRVQKNITYYAEIFRISKNVQKSVDYEENTLHYAAISKVNKIDNKLFSMC